MSSGASERAGILLRNAAALGELQAGLSAGLREIPGEFLDRMEPLAIPPVDEARLRAFSKAAAAQAKGDVLVVLGLGPPVMARMLREELPADCGLAFIEPTLEIAVRLLSQHDYRGVLAGGMVAMVFAGDDRSLQGQMEALVVQWGVSELQLVMNPMRPLGDRISELVGELLRGALRGVELATATSAKYGRDSLSNIARNLPEITAGHDVSELAGSLSGVPAFLIGAGPVLDGVQGLLPKLAGHGVVVACDAALPILMANGAPPDAVATLDVVPAKAALFEQEYVRDALLVALAGAHPELVRSWIGPRAFAMDDHPLARWVAPYAAPVLSFGQLGNVAHLGYAFARFLGCDPVVLCGVDYAVGDFGGMYARGVKHGAPLHIDTLPQEVKATLMEAPSAGGGTVKTLKNMAVYGDTLGRMASAGGTTYTISGKSLKMAGVQHLPLEAVLERTGQHRVARPLTGQAPGRERVEARRQALKDALGLLEAELRAYSADALEFAEATDAKGATMGRDAGAEEAAVRELRPRLEAFGRHSGVIEIIEPLQPAVTFEINRLLRKTRGMDDPVQRARTRLLALGGPAASGAALAEFAADQVRGARIQLGRKSSGRMGRAGEGLDG